MTDGPAADSGGLFAALPGHGAAALRALSTHVSFPEGSRLFEEGGPADRFWVVTAGTVALDTHIPGRPPAVVETVGAADLVGWSWLVPPHQWRLGATAVTTVSARQFDAAEVLALCARDPVLGQALNRYVAGVVGRRLASTRTRLLDLYAPGAARGEPHTGGGAR
ncbi:cyclic nucleotide-binding domain-containing protein [Streptomyces sp. HNM0663]|uniref:Cyclic nucleotide-binding domain-containing protein n=1 Tax=Streptomyces chengmaiensis TaxID=3040919 RepID=A0ABT6HGM3_9ACTN|nr:cyclic nucleotide-binding domain-containing protein [Streptomyces chengmaiensis]MDH2387912.1 cyclic nucleotide-binding domain-containing protein [Streptomyces chengmaiensis]